MIALHSRHHRPVIGDEVAGLFVALAVQGVLDGFGRVTVGFAPLRGLVADGLVFSRSSATEFADEELGEKVMVPAPLPVTVKRDEEQVGALDMRKHFTAVRMAGNR